MNLLGKGCDIEGRLLDSFAIFHLAVDWDSVKARFLLLFLQIFFQIAVGIFNLPNGLECDF
jgi:hypothetical protein